MGKPNMEAQLGGVGVEAMQTENRGHVGFGSEADIGIFGCTFMSPPPGPIVE